MKTIITLFLLLSAATSFAAGGIKVNGDLTLAKDTGDPFRVLYFSNGTSQFAGQPWGFNNLDLYYLGGNVGIGTFTPSTKLDVNGTVNATGYSGNGSGLTNVTASSVADGSITDAKISGTISAAKLDLSTVQKKYGKVAVVAKSGGDYSDPVTAMAGVATWCGTPSASNPCLLKIMPGLYDLGSETLVMQSYVDIEGAGEIATTITSSVNSMPAPYNGTVNGANNAEIRLLTINNTATTGSCAGMYNNSRSPRISNVTANAVGVGGSSHHGMYNTSNSSPIMTNITATASGAGNNYGINNTGSSSPTMTNVTASARGADMNYGVANLGSSGPVMNNIIASASGGTSNIGVYNVHSSSPRLSNVIASGTGGIGGYGMRNFGTGANISIDRSTFEGSTNSIGNYAGWTLMVGASRLIGPKDALGTYVLSGVYEDTGTVTANAFSGNGSALTNVNASTVSNGVYTTGSYADPSWITSLAGSKINTGTVAIANGGSGATSAPTALTNLGAVAKAGDTMTGSLTVQGNITATGTGPMPVYNNTGTAITVPHMVTGTTFIDSNAKVALSGSAVFHDASSYTCTATGHGISAPPIGIQYDTGEQFTLLADGFTVTASYICVGN